MKKLFLALVLFAGCSTIGQTLVVTGESMKGIEKEFVQVAAIFKDGCDVSKLIKAADCNRFRSFGEKFKTQFPLAVQLWEAARAANDQATQGQIQQMIQGLATDLATFAVLLIETYKQPIAKADTIIGSQTFRLVGFERR